MTDEDDRERIEAFLRDYETICWRHHVVITGGWDPLHLEPIRCDKILDQSLAELRETVTARR